MLLLSGPAGASPELPPALERPAGADAGSPRAIARFSAYLEDQGDTMGCGTTSLGMLMSWWRGTPGRYDRAGLDRLTRRVDVGLSPSHLATVAHACGFRATAARAEGLESLAPWLDRGVPVIALYENGAPDEGRFHFVVVLALEKDARGQVTGVVLADPSHGELRRRTPEDFLARWSRLRLGAIDTGLARVFVAVLPEAPVPVRGPDGRVTSSGEAPWPAEADLGWRNALFERYVAFSNAAGPVCEPLGLTWW